MLAFVQFPKGDFARMERGDLGGDLAALAVEEDGFVARLKPENGAGVMRFGAGQDRSVGIPLVRRDVEAMHAEGRNVQRSTRNVQCFNTEGR